MHVESILEEKMFQRNVKRPKKTLQMQMVFLKKCHSKAGFQTKIKFPLIWWLSDNGKVIWKPIKAACVEHCGEPCGFLINSVSFLLISLCYFIFDEMHWLSEIKQYFSDSIYFGVFSQFMASCFVQFLSHVIFKFCRRKKYKTFFTFHKAWFGMSHCIPDVSTCFARLLGSVNPLSQQTFPVVFFLDDFQRILFLFDLSWRFRDNHSRLESQVFVIVTFNEWSHFFVIIFIYFLIDCFTNSFVEKSVRDVSSITCGTLLRSKRAY